MVKEAVKFGVLVILVVTGLWLLSSGYHGVQYNSSPGTITTSVTMHSTLTTVASTAPSTTLVVPVPSEDDALLREQALSELDPVLCLSLSTESGVSECVTSVARKTGDAGVCDTVSGTPRDNCLYSMAVSSRNDSLCNSIGDSSSRNRCLAVVNKDLSYCSKILTVLERDWCIYRVTMQGREVSYCAKINTPSIRDDCYFFFLTERRMDANYCQKIVNDSVRDKCFLEHVKAGKMNPSLCWVLTDSVLKEECYSYAVNESSTQSCRA